MRTCKMLVKRYLPWWGDWQQEFGLALPVQVDTYRWGDTNDDRGFIVAGVHNVGSSLEFYGDGD